MVHLLIKKALCLLCGVAVILSAAGCGISNNNYKTTSSQTETIRRTEKSIRIEEAEKYLSDKYDDSFSYVTTHYSAFGTTYSEFDFKSDRFGEETFKVYVDYRGERNSHGRVVSHDKDENGNFLYDCYDTYYELLLNDDAQNYFTEKASDSFTDNVVIKVNLNNSYYAAKKAKNVNTWEDFLSSQIESSVLCCYTESFENMEKDIRKYVSDLKKSGITADLDFVTVKANSFNALKDMTYDSVWDNWKTDFIERKWYSMYADRAEVQEYELIVY